MSFLLLATGLLTPWGLGYLLLATLCRADLRRPGELATLAAYGFFLGYALTATALWLGARLVGVFPFASILGFELFVVGLLLWRGGRRDSVPDASPRTRSSGAFNSFADSSSSASPLSLPMLPLPRWLVILIFFALGAQLTAIAIEIVYRPVFPWDAWLNWMYRAKVWFYSDAMLSFAEPSAWVEGQRLASYNVDGAHYPSLVPLIALWSALSLGQWTDTLINLPCLLAALALALGVYGQCRALEIEPRVSLLCSYALLSMPLVGTHFALAGQADIWLSCYAGLGIIALLRGLLKDDRRQLMLGLLFCLIGCTVKIEGSLWLLLAALLLAAGRYPAWGLRAALALFSLLAGFALLAPDALWTDAVGSILGALAAPVAGSGSAPELADDYLQNYLLGGSWHLAGWLSLLALPFLLLHCARGQRYAILAVTALALQGSMLLVIFSYSTHSAWAEDWTAINRLPLQLIPVHCVIWALVADRYLREAGPPPSRRQQASIALISVLAVILLGAALLFLDTGTAQTERRYPAASLRPMIGGGQVESEQLVLSRYRGNLALASSGTVSLNIAERPLVEVRTAGTNRRAASFFWRPADDPGNLQSRSLPVRGTAIIDLRDAAEQAPLISEFGVLAYRDSQGNPLRIGDVRFLSASGTTLLRKLWLDWSQPAFWTQKSAHWIAAGHPTPLLPLPLAAAVAALLLGLCAVLILRRQPSQVAYPLLSALVILWLLLDARWLANRFQQAQRTLASYPPVTARTHDFSNDALTLSAIEMGASDTDVESVLIISAERSDMRYEMLRAKYHVAPRRALVLETLDPRALNAGDELLLLRSPYGGRADRSIDSFRELLRGSPLSLRVVNDSPGATRALLEARRP